LRICNGGYLVLLHEPTHRHRFDGSVKPFKTPLHHVTMTNVVDHEGAQGIQISPYRQVHQHVAPGEPLSSEALLKSPFTVGISQPPDEAVARFRCCVHRGNECNKVSHLRRSQRILRPSDVQLS